MSETYGKLVPLASKASPSQSWPPSSKATRPRASLPSHPCPVRTIGRHRPSAPPDYLASPRCSEKGCIFPATESSTGRCLLHALEEHEPTFFVSCQPTTLVVEQAKFGEPDPEADYSRAQDRRRLAAWREAFMEELA